MNSLNLVGRLTKDIGELKGTENKVGLFTIAVNRPYANQNGDREADFIQIKVFNKTAENCKKFLSKGSLVSVSAHLQTGKYTKDGKNNYYMEVIADDVRFLDTKGIKNNSPNDERTGDNNQHNGDTFAGGTVISEGDDWPF